MDFATIVEYVRAAFRELVERKFTVALTFFAISFMVMLVGLMLPVSYQTSTTIFADNQNILKPLLDDQVEVSKLQDRTNLVRDVLQSPRILDEVVTQVYGESLDPMERQSRINRIRNHIEVNGLGASHVRIGYSDSSAESAFTVLSQLTDTFIADRSNTKRNESREAFEFIDNQVVAYKSQLVDAEAKLKQFNAESFDGRDRDVDASISRIRMDLEELGLSIEESQAIVVSLRSQLASESSVGSQKFRSDIYRERLGELLTRKDTLLRSVTEAHPDVVNLNAQISDMEVAILEAENSESSEAAGDSQQLSVNPIYIDLRTKLSQAEVQLQGLRRRYASKEKLLDQEYERRVRIAAREAQLAELNRDYDVTKGIYEDMLARKEKARLSMTLSLEGQGVVYRIQEPVVYPLAPQGLVFSHFVVLGPILALMFIFGVAVLYFFLDSRYRFERSLESFVAPIAILAVVPHVRTPISKRIMRRDIIVLLLMILLLAAAYAATAYLGISGQLSFS